MIGSSRPRGPGIQLGLGGRPAVLAFLMASGIVVLGGVPMDVTPAQVDGGAGLVLVNRFSNLLTLNISLKFIMRTPVDESSRTMGGPSRMVTRRVIDSSRRTSSRNGA